MPRIAVLVAVLSLVLACSKPANNAYPLRAEPGGGSTMPAGVGEPSSTTVAWLNARTGDRIELLDAEALGTLDGATTEVLASRPVHYETGEWVIGEALEPLAGVIVESTTATPDPAETVGIVVTLTASQPGVYTVTSIRLRYRLNDGEIQVTEGIDAVMVVCVDDPQPATCERPPSL